MRFLAASRRASNVVLESKVLAAMNTRGRSWCVGAMTNTDNKPYRIDCSVVSGLAPKNRALNARPVSVVAASTARRWERVMRRDASVGAVNALIQGCYVRRVTHHFSSR